MSNESQARGDSGDGAGLSALSMRTSVKKKRESRRGPGVPELEKRIREQKLLDHELIMPENDRRPCSSPLFAVSPGPLPISSSIGSTSNIPVRSPPMDLPNQCYSLLVRPKLVNSVLDQHRELPPKQASWAVDYIKIPIVKKIFLANNFRAPPPCKFPPCLPYVEGAVRPPIPHRDPGQVHRGSKQEKEPELHHCIKDPQGHQTYFGYGPRLFSFQSRRSTEMNLLLSQGKMEGLQQWSRQHESSSGNKQLLRGPSPAMGSTENMSSKLCFFSSERDEEHQEDDIDLSLKL
ncbi:hypothetical protein CDL15_Pgr016771 [Punica granatum]|uniref:Uncharacterized protein n=1 Tax=Punica granatum TaxID=22663 RepID=A0A218WXD8_PUNGR|nr:hypothetical protein CDL15_Pgr016771 [Punica granatum]